MEENKTNKLQKKLYHSFDGFLFRLINNIRRNNTSVIKWLIFIFLGLLFIYFLLYLQSSNFPVSWSFEFWEPKVAIPSFVTITGLFFTIIVLFTIVPKGTQTGDQFLYLLINEIDSLKKNEEITIISPNINIGTTTYKTLLETLINSIMKAKNRGAKVSFITKSLSAQYLNSFTKDDKISTYSSFYVNGSSNDSEMLTFLSDSFNKHRASNEDYENTIDHLKLLVTLIEMREPKTTILDDRIVGFLSNSKLYIGKYYPNSSNGKQITVKGEFIDTLATVQMLKDNFIKDL